MYIVWRGAGEKMKFPLKERAEQGCGSVSGYSDGIWTSERSDLDSGFPMGWIRMWSFRRIVSGSGFSEGIYPLFRRVGSGVSKGLDPDPFFSEMF